MPETPAHPHRPRARRQRLLGDLLVKEGLINRVQLEKALRLQETLEPRPCLGEILVDQKLVTQSEIDAILDKYHKEYRLGDVLIETRVITKAQLDVALAHQRKTDVRLGDALVELGFVTERQFKEALCLQLKIAFVDLDHTAIDPSLSTLISESYARHHRVIPIARVDDWIILAMEDPTDGEVLEDLRWSTGCRIEVVTSSRARMERAFVRLYGPRPVTGPEPEARRDEDDEAAARARAEPIPREAERQPPDAAPGAPEEPVAGAPGGGGGARLPGVRFSAFRARVVALRQLVSGCEALVGALEALLRERDERRAGCERLEHELRETHGDNERLHRELAAVARALAELGTAHAAVVEREAAARRALGELREQYEALVRDRERTAGQLEMVVRRLGA